jgi:nicotinic acetylcholine receptor
MSTIFHLPGLPCFSWVTTFKAQISGLYYGVSICLVSFASAMAVVTLNIHYRGLRGAEVPTKVKTIFLRFLARIVFVQYAAPAKKERRAEKNFHVSLFCYLRI